MQRIGLALAIVGALLLGVVLLPSSVAAQDGSSQPTSTIHVVQSGENLWTISRQYGVTVNAIADANGIADVGVIVTGRQLFIPGAPPAEPPQQGGDDGTETPTPPAPNGDTVVHVVQPGENLYRIAQLYGTTIQEIIRLNNLSDPNGLLVGQELVVRGTPVATTPPPATTPATVVPVETETPVAPETATTETPTTAPETASPEATVATPVVPVTDADTAEFGFGYGVEASVVGLDGNAVINRLNELGVTWVKHTIDWGRYEPTQGEIDFAALDDLVATLEGSEANILLTVVGTPEWARVAPENMGSAPQNYNAYASFVGALAERYGDRVDAYEIWSQPNLAQSWAGKPLTGAEYVSLLQTAYAAIKVVNPEAVVVSAGLAPTGGDGVNAINDVDYLRQMYAAGVAAVSDAIGAHPYGFANSPDSTCCQNDPAVTQFNNHPSFFFLDTLGAYRAVMEENGDAETLIWATEFGWGSNENFPVMPPTGFEFVSTITLDQQSLYLERAFALGNSLGYVGPMFAWNLNFCQAYTLEDYQCFWSMLDPAGNPRPVFGIFSAIQK